MLLHDVAAWRIVTCLIVQAWDAFGATQIA